MKKPDEAKAIALHLREWLQIYLPQIRACSPHTLKSYLEGITLYITFLSTKKGINADSLSGESFADSIVEEYILWLKKDRGCKNTTCNQRLTCVKEFLKYLAKKDLRFMQMQMDVCDMRPQKCPKEEYREISQDAIKALFKSIDASASYGARDFTLFFLMYSIAARIDEILSLKMSDIHFDDNGNRSYLSIRGKGNKYRSPPILPDVKKVLKSYIKQYHGKEYDGDDYLFYSTYGGVKKMFTQNAITKRLRLHAAIAHGKCGQVPLDLHCHDLRHARASHWLEEKLNIVAIQRLMGHADIQTTMRYIFVTTEQKNQALAMLENDSVKDVAKKWKTGKHKKDLLDFLGLVGKK